MKNLRIKAFPRLLLITAVALLQGCSFMIGSPNAENPLIGLGDKIDTVKAGRMMVGVFYLDNNVVVDRRGLGDLRIGGSKSRVKLDRGWNPVTDVEDTIIKTMSGKGYSVLPMSDVNNGDTLRLLNRYIKDEASKAFKEGLQVKYPNTYPSQVQAVFWDQRIDYLMEVIHWNVEITEEGSELFTVGRPVIKIIDLKDNSVIYFGRGYAKTDVGSGMSLNALLDNKMEKLQKAYSTTVDEIFTAKGSGLESL